MALFTLFILACLASPLLHSNTATATATAIAPRSNAAPSGLIDYVCNLTTHSAFCHALLDPSISTTDPYELAEVVFGFTYYNATSTKDYIHSWLRSNKNNTKRGVREGMLDCEGCYKQAIGVLQKMSNDLKIDILKGWEIWQLLWRNVDCVVEWLSGMDIQTPS